MAGVLVKSKKKRPEKFSPPRSHGIQTVEDAVEPPASPAETQLEQLGLLTPRINGRLSHGPTAKPTPPAALRELGELIAIEVDEVQPNPFQPRQVFDEAEIAELAKSLEEHGLLEPIVVRRSAEGSLCSYELVAGERRLRAARRNQWAEIPARLIECSDAYSREAALIENIDRKDLSDIELARGFAELIEHNGYTADTLADRLGRSRSYVANLVRLLELPEAWQQRVVSREIPSTHARYLLPYKEAPAVLKAVDKWIETSGGVPALKTWERELNRMVREAASPLSRHVSVWSQDAKDGKSHYCEVRIDPKHPQYSELQVVEVDQWGSKKKVALNASLARKILSEKARAYNEKYRKPKAEKGTAAATVAKAPSKAEQAAAAKADREAFIRELRELCSRWHLYAASTAIKEADAQICQRLLLFVAAGYDEADLFEELRHLLEKRFKKAPGLAILQPHSPDNLARELLAELFAVWSTQTGWSARHAPAIAKLLEVDPADDWDAKRPDGTQVMLGPLTEEYFDLHSEAQLRSLCEELKVELSDRDDLGKQDLIGFIRETSAIRRLPLPAELAELLGTKKAARPRKAK